MVRGPVRRSYREARFTRQDSAASARSAGVKFTCTSFSASAKVAGDTSGPTAGPVPNAGGAPGGSSVGSCASSPAWPSALLPEATAAPMRPSEVCAKKCLRDLDMGPPRSIVAESCTHKAGSPFSFRAGWPANRKWSTGNYSLAYDDARVGKVRPKENRRQGALRVLEGKPALQLLNSRRLRRGYEYGRTTEPGLFAR